MLPVTPYGGQLPVEAWPKADSLVQAAWDVYSTLYDRVTPKITDNTSYLTGILATFKKNVENFSAQTERLKHGPPFQSDTVIDDYLAWGSSFESWANQIDATADFGTTWSMFRTVGAEILSDVSAFAVTVGQGAMGAIKGVASLGAALPFILVGLAALYLVVKAKK